MASVEKKQLATEVAYKLAYALDALNKEELFALLPKDKKFNFDISAILGIPSKDITAEEHYKEAILNLGGFDATQHMLSAPLVTLGERTAHVKVMVNAYHGLIREKGVDSASARVFWFLDLEETSGGGYIIYKWAVGSLLPMDYPDIFQEGHKRGHAGQFRKGLKTP